MSAILSICIPTFNRAEFLKECLNSVLLSARGFEQQLEIVISDNASTDSTYDVIRVFQCSDPWIRYYRKDTTVSAEINFYDVANAATGQYIWVFGDDDRMELGAIECVLAKIESGFGLIICNYSVWDKHFSFRKKLDGLNKGKEQSFADPNLLLRRFHLYLGYISAVVFRKPIFFMLKYDEYESFVQYGFPFMYSIYTGVINDKCRATYISASIVRNRSGNASSGDEWYKVFVTGSSLIFDALSTKGYSKEAIHVAKRNVIKNCVIPRIAYEAASGTLLRIQTLNMLLPHYKGILYFWVVCLPLFLLPGRFIFVLRQAYLKIRSDPQHPSDRGCP